MNTRFAKQIPLWILVLAVVHASGCAKDPAHPPARNASEADRHHLSNKDGHDEHQDTRFAVIPDGEWIQANVHGFNIRITSEGMFRRCFDWGTGNHCVDLFALHSGKGIGTPGGKDIWSIKATGARRLLYSEYPMDYTEAENQGVFGRNRRRGIIVWRNDGLVVRAHLEPNYILVVMVYQIYVDGEKPVSLDGADDNAIHTSWDTL